MKIIEIFDGNELHDKYDEKILKHTYGEKKCEFMGVSENVPLDNSSS
jgi:hypothetical protein